MSTKARIVIGALTLSAAAFVGLIGQEGYTDMAVIPVKGDVPTVGFGMTKRPDGSPVQMGDRTTPVEAARRTLEYTRKTDLRLHECVTAPLHQEEYDLLADHSYQYGQNATCSSPMVRRVNSGDYLGACAGYLEYKFIPEARGSKLKYDCSTPGNKRCWGVWARSKARYDKCMAVQ